MFPFTSLPSYLCIFFHLSGFPLVSLSSFNMYISWHSALVIIPFTCSFSEQSPPPPVSTNFFSVGDSQMDFSSPNLFSELQIHTVKSLLAICFISLVYLNQPALNQLFLTSSKAYSGQNTSSVLILTHFQPSPWSCQLFWNCIAEEIFGKYRIAQRRTRTKEEGEERKQRRNRSWRKILIMLIFQRYLVLRCLWVLLESLYVWCVCVSLSVMSNSLWPHGL